jgi:hypothetical protein
LAEAARKYAGARTAIRDGGDHTLRFPAYPAHSQFAESPSRERPLRGDGEFKVGAVLASHRLRCKSARTVAAQSEIAQVLLRFEQPRQHSCSRPPQFAAALDTDFLWQCSGAGIRIQDGAQYVGRDPTATKPPGSCSSCIRRRCISIGAAGDYHPHEETLKLALAGLEKSSASRNKSPHGAIHSLASIARGNVPEG